MPRSTCGGCHKIFSSTTAFDHHRIGGYGSPLYDSEKQRLSHQAATRFTPHARRCMSDAEMLAAGFASERKPVVVTRKGQNHTEECDIWYEPEAREKLRQAYAEDNEEESDDERLKG